MRRSLENQLLAPVSIDRKSTRLNSSHMSISYAVFCLKKKTTSSPSPPATAAHSQHRARGRARSRRARHRYVRHARHARDHHRPGCPPPFFFFNDPPPPEIYPLPLHDALPI